MEADPYGEDMEEVRLKYERERHWRIVFEDNKVGVDYEKSIIHAKRCF